MANNLQILNDKYLPDFQAALKDRAIVLPENPPNRLPLDDFSFYTSVAAAYSSMIEGEAIEVDSYLKSKLNKGAFQQDYTKKTDDLQAAYQFARTHKLNLENLLKTHEILSQNLLTKAHRGRIRTGMEFILDAAGNIEYVAAAPAIVQQETERLFEDITLLLEMPLSLEECLYYAAFSHLLFLKVHPLADGNGRTARLLEKWFLASKLGEKAWHIPSEKYYYDHLQDYYRKVHIGVDYEGLNFDRVVPFLLLLVGSLEG